MKECPICLENFNEGKYIEIEYKTHFGSRPEIGEYEVQFHYGMKWICENCFDNLKTCSECNHNFIPHDWDENGFSYIYELESEKGFEEIGYLCESCQEDYLSSCSICDKLFLISRNEELQDLIKEYNNDHDSECLECFKEKLEERKIKKRRL